jgi:rhodanese-related sulfurtransferase
MKIMNRETLKEKLDRGDNFKLYMTLGWRAFEYSHIPGSIHLNNVAAEAATLSPDEEIVVYCSHPLCSSSINAYKQFDGLGFKNFYRYAGGLMEWQDAGYPLEGIIAKECV